VIWDIGAVLSGLAALLAAIWSRQAKKNAAKAVEQTNGPLQRQGAELADQSLTLGLILDGQRSLGHQIGEVRSDLGRLDTRVTGDLAELRGRLDSGP
jgi:hypothetical protein